MMGTLHFPVRFIHGLLFLVTATEAAKMVACDNFITRNIPGGREAVNLAADQHRAWMQNMPALKKGPYIRWKYEFDTSLDSVRLPKCEDFHTFGKSYDEMKMFCSPPAQRKDCNVYSLGSNNMWEFEEQMFNDTECQISTFDCTVNGKIPPAITERTKFYQRCIGNSSISMKGAPMVRMTDLASLTGVNSVDYLKIDIEGYEWLILRDMIAAVKENPTAENSLPLQLFIEFHLNRSPEKIPYHGDNLRKIFAELFEIGYMMMYRRKTVQAKNSDALLVKVLCNPDLM